MSNLEIPYGIGLKGLIEVIGGWNRAKADENPVSINAVAGKTSLSTKSVSRQNRFLLQIGFIERKGNEYALTQRGKLIAELADYKQDNEFKGKLKELILTWRNIDLLLEYIRENQPLDWSILSGRIMMYSDRPSTDKNAKNGSETFIELLKDLGIVVHRGSTISLVDELSYRWRPDVVESDLVLSDQDTFELPIVLTELEIRNVRSISYVKIPLKKMNILIGENSSGKSSILYSLLALRDLKMGYTDATPSFKNFYWLRRLGTTEPMVVTLNGKVSLMKTTAAVNLVSAFQPTKSYCTQLCTTLNKTRLCDTSYESEKEGFPIPLEYFKGLSTLRKIAEKLKKGTPEIIQELKRTYDTSSNQVRKIMLMDSGLRFSILELNEENETNFTYKIRDFLEAWPGIFPEFLRNESVETTKDMYTSTRFLLSQYIEKMVYIPLQRGFITVQYPQMDQPPEFISDDQNFPGQILNLMVYADSVSSEDNKRIIKWAKSFGIEDFEVVLQKDRKVMGRGHLKELQERIPIALLGFGSNQFLSVIGKCIFAPEQAPILIEEPEIHLHPEKQALAADFLIETMKKGHQVFIATHSEHFIARIQRRLAEGLLSIKDIAILWVKHDSEKEGTTVEEVTINERGIFHKGLETYLRFSQDEINNTQSARDQRRNK